jgi:hypothetical protein
MQYLMSVMSIWFVAFNCWVNKDSFNVITVSINRVSTILSPAHSVINELHCHILPKWMYWSAFWRKRQMTRSLPHPKNQGQWSINDFWLCVMKHPVCCVVTLTQNRTIRCLSREKWWWQHCYYALKMSVTRASTTCGIVSWKIQGLCGNVTP